MISEKADFWKSFCEGCDKDDCTEPLDECEAYVKLRTETVEKVINAVKESPGRYAEYLDGVIRDHLADFEPDEIKALFPELFK